MLIHECGEIIRCTKIKFEDNKLDLEQYHPGIILLPTSEKESVIHCIYMTSDSMRAKIEGKKYIKNTGKSVMESYINLQQIVDRVNIKDEEIDRLTDSQFLHILEQFYDYQIKIDPQREAFLGIKSKIESLIEILKFQKYANIKERVQRHELDLLDNKDDINDRIFLYKVYTIINSRKKQREIGDEIFITSKEKNYYNVLIKLYDKINKINFSKLDLNNPNNDLRNVFLATARNHYLLNTNMLFEDIALIRRMENPEDRSSNLIMDFIKLEKKREEDKANVRARKSYERDCKATQKKIDIAKQKMDIKRENGIQKYGQFDFDI